MIPQVQFISVLGPPGSGKGTQCALLKARYQCEHISVGDLLRAEANDPDSPYMEILQENLKHGRIGTKEMTVGIVERKLKILVKQGVQTIFLDGFPRKLDTAEYFEETIGPMKIIVILACPTEVLEKRLSQRNRDDDDAETIRKRVTVYNETTSKVTGKYREKGKVVEIDADNDMELVTANLLEILQKNSVNMEKR